MVKNWINKQVKERGWTIRRFGREIRVETPHKRTRPSMQDGLALPIRYLGAC